MSSAKGVSWGTVIDLESCIGCHACSVACRAEFDRPGSDGHNHVRVAAFGRADQLRQHYVVNRCLQCEDAPCVRICPTGALAQRADGIVDLDQDACLGCHLCQLACPYDAISMDAERGVAEKCNLCVHRLESGLEPACATACPTGAIRVGDIGDPNSAPGALLRDGTPIARRPELNTRPRVHLVGLSSDALDPLNVRRPSLPTLVATELLGAAGSSAGPGPQGLGALHYEAPLRPPWDWRAAVAYWARSIAAGLFLAPGLLILVGALKLDSLVWRMVIPMVALVYLSAALALQAWMAERPGRLMMLLKRPNFRSLAVLGIGTQLAFAALLLASLTASLFRIHIEALVLAAGFPIAMAVVITPGLALRQCRGRELWMRASLLPRMLLSSLTAGAAMVSPFIMLLSPEQSAACNWQIALGSLATLMLWYHDAKRPPQGGNGARASWNMVAGNLRLWTVSATALLTAGLLAPLMDAWIAPFVLGGLLAYEHSFLQAGQSVPQV